MRTLITGGSSLLGKSLWETKPNTIELTSTWFTNYVGSSKNPMLQLDIGNKSQVAYIFEKARPEVVIHCAGVGSVDYTETHYVETYQVNVFGTQNVLKAAEDFGSLFVYISTNAVFDGKNPPYSESSERNPVNRYGAIKREAEDMVSLSKRWLIIRPFLLYGWHYLGGRSNWVTIIKNKLSKGEGLKLVNDIYWQPTLAQDVASAIWRLIQLPQAELRQGGEIYHVASDEVVTLYEFGLAIGRVWHPQRVGLLEPVSADEFKHLAPRPVDTTYNLEKIHNLGIQLRGVEEGLRAMR